jgi:hypothetical protein
MKINIYKLLTFIVNIILTPAKYRKDYWCSLLGSRILHKNHLPWMNYRAIEYIDSYVSSKFTVFEYGSGSSTLYWLARGCEVTSVEHDRVFYSQLSKKLDSQCDYLLIEPVLIECESGNNPESPDLFHSEDFIGYSFESYVKYIDQFPDKYFDMIVIDGRARASCIKRALPKLKKSGILVVDNSDRTKYFTETAELLKSWSRKTFKGTVRGLLHQEHTTVFVKPSEISTPIALFTYARPNHTRRTVEALLRNPEASNHDLIVFSDAASTLEKQLAVDEVRAYLATISGFRSVCIHYRPYNFGLSKSIVEGVTEVLRVHERIIVLEDDLVTSPYFLAYMNQALEKYAEDDRVVSIHGYVYPIKKSLPEAFFLRGADCWAWATWQHEWGLFNPNGQYLLDELKRRRLIGTFNFNGSYSYSAMLEAQIHGKNDSWAVRWYASAFLADKLTLYPGRSLVHNIGFDGEGVHCDKTLFWDTQLSSDPIILDDVQVKHYQPAWLAFEKHFKKGKPGLLRRITSIFKAQMRNLL